MGFPAPEAAPLIVAKPSRAGGMEENFQAPETRARRRFTYAIIEQNIRSSINGEKSVQVMCGRVRRETGGR